MSIEDDITAAVQAALEPFLRRLAEPEPLVYSVPQAARVLCTTHGAANAHPSHRRGELRGLSDHPA